MPNFSGVWNLKDQVQAIAAGRWTGVPFYELYAWGYNFIGALGVNSTINLSSPVQVGSLTTWNHIAAGANHSLSVKSDGTMWSWGYNGNGQVGDGTVVSRSSPVQIGALTNWSQADGGSTFSSSIKTDGTLWTWGKNNAGSLGINITGGYRSSPVQVGALTTWSFVACGDDQIAAISTSGSLWTWGSNINGALGQNISVSVYRSSPVQVGALTDWLQVSGGGNHTATVKTNGTLWAWGRNAQGQVGDGTVVNRSSPVQIGALTTWAKVGCGSIHTAAIKTDGTLWVWGFNTNGRLGDGTTVSRSSPVQVGALTNWSNVVLGSGSGIAIKNDRTLWTWGVNTSGQLGDNTVVSRSSPVQVGSLAVWSEIAAGGTFALAAGGLTN